MITGLSTFESLMFSNEGFFSEWLSGWNVGGLILMLIGAALIIVEMVIPGFGIAGISGGAACIAGLVISSNSFGGAMFSLAILVIILFIAAIIIFKFIFGNGKKASRIILNEHVSRSEYSDKNNIGSLIGKNGIALTSLRPSGIAMIEGKRVDVLAVGEFISKGDVIKVTDAQGIKIIVEKATNHA